MLSLLVAASGFDSTRVRPAPRHPARSSGPPRPAQTTRTSSHSRRSNPLMVDEDKPSNDLGLLGQLKNMSPSQAAAAIAFVALQHGSYVSDAALSDQLVKEGTEVFLSLAVGQAMGRLGLEYYQAWLERQPAPAQPPPPSALSPPPPAFVELPLVKKTPPPADLPASPDRDPASSPAPRDGAGQDEPRNPAVPPPDGEPQP